MISRDGKQYSWFTLSVKASTLASLFVVEAHDECVRVIDLADKSSRSDAQSFLACTRAFADPCTRVSSQWKEDRLVDPINVEVVVGLVAHWKHVGLPQDHAITNTKFIVNWTVKNRSSFSSNFEGAWLSLLHNICCNLQFIIQGGPRKNAPLEICNCNNTVDKMSLLFIFIGYNFFLTLKKPGLLAPSHPPGSRLRSAKKLCNLAHTYTLSRRRVSRNFHTEKSKRFSNYANLC